MLMDWEPLIVFALGTLFGSGMTLFYFWHRV